MTDYKPAECMGTAPHEPHEFNGGMYCPGLGQIRYEIDDEGEMFEAGKTYQVSVTEVTQLDDTSQDLVITMHVEGEVTPSPRHQLISDLARLLAGIEVPGSLGTLGVGAEYWRKIHAAAGFGYVKAEEYETYLRSVLG